MLSLWEGNQDDENDSIGISSSLSPRDPQRQEQQSLANAVAEGALGSAAGISELSTMAAKRKSLFKRNSAVPRFGRRRGNNHSLGQDEEYSDEQLELLKTSARARNKARRDRRIRASGGSTSSFSLYPGGGGFGPNNAVRSASGIGEHSNADGADSLERSTWDSRIFIGQVDKFKPSAELSWNDEEVFRFSGKQGVWMPSFSIRIGDDESSAGPPNGEPNLPQDGITPPLDKSAEERAQRRKERAARKRQEWQQFKDAHDAAKQHKAAAKESAWFESRFSHPVLYNPPKLAVPSTVDQNGGAVEYASEAALHTNAQKAAWGPRRRKSPRKVRRNAQPKFGRRAVRGVLPGLPNASSASRRKRQIS